MNVFNWWYISHITAFGVKSMEIFFMLKEKKGTSL